MTDDFELVAAIDFGTTYSGYAYCSRQDFERSPLIIKTSSWKSGTGSSDKFMKTPTMVLFDSNGEFDSFGFEAEEKYRKLAVRNRHGSWYFFRRFKMRLHQKQTDVSMLTSGVPQKQTDVSMLTSGVPQKQTDVSMHTSGVPQNVKAKKIFQV